MKGINSMNEFRRIEIEDYELLRSYVEKGQQIACDYTPANLALWGKVYKTEFCIMNEMLVLRFRNQGKEQFSFPIGDGDLLKTIDWMKAYCKEKEIPFILNKVEPHMLRLLGDAVDEYQVELDRDSFDYIYTTEALGNLSGKKYHGKKNHINKFKKNIRIGPMKPSLMRIQKSVSRW